MRCEIYGDLLLAEVFLWNLCILALINDRFWNAAGWGRILLGSALGAGIYFAALFMPMGAFLKCGAGLAGSLFMLLFVFRVREARGIFLVMGAYWTSTVLFASLVLGMLRLVRERWSGWTYGMIMALEILTALIGRKLWRYFRKHGEGYGKAILVNGGRRAEVRAFVDTGNSLVEPVSKCPACVLDGMTAKALWNGNELFRVVPWHGVGMENGILKAYRLEKMTLYLGGPPKEIKNAYVAIDPNGEDCLVIQPKILEGR